MKIYRFKNQDLTILQISLLPECRVDYKLLYNRVCMLDWPIDKAISVPKGTTLKAFFRKEKSKPEAPSKPSLNPLLKIDREIIRKEKLKQIFRRPIKPTSSYVYWVTNHGGSL